MNIKNASIAEIAGLVASAGEPRHRTSQILKWLYQKGVRRFDEMTNLPKALRADLGGRCEITELRPVDSVRSSEDGSQKFLLESDDGVLVETVLMQSRGYRTLCISTQVGCALACGFCRTGTAGCERNLRCDEILNQVLFFRRDHIPGGARYNIVFMGMGEPLLNLHNLVRALEILNSNDAFALGEKRITVSTIGMPDRIDELAGSGLKFGLAVSLNATTDERRRELMPAARDLAETLGAAERFARSRRTRVTLEYVLLDGVNDTDEDARRLAALTAKRPFKINIIPFNEWEGAPFRRPDDHRIEGFVRLLLPTAPAVTVRRSLGRDIGAACGQLRWSRGSGG